MPRNQIAVLFALTVLLFASVPTSFAMAEDDLVQRATQASQLTLPGSPSFHLRAQVGVAGNASNRDYKAEIEEYWVSPTKWRRMVSAQGFSSTLIVNGDKVAENATGGYYPLWLRALVNAIFDPGAPLVGLHMSASSDNPVSGGKQFCRRFESLQGIPPVGNRVFSTFCFEGERIASVGMPGYHADYSEYRKFGSKQVARTVGEYLQPGVELEARITELSELSNVDESLFQITSPAPAISTVRVSEEILRKLANTDLDVQWPTIRLGKTKGVLSIFVCLDRNGKVREVYGLNSDHPDMTVAAMTQVSGVQFKPAEHNGALVQVEGILTFAYQTVVGDPYPNLNDAEARKLAISLQEPHFPPSIPAGTEVTISIWVAEDGEVHTSGPFRPAAGPVEEFMSGEVKTWKFNLPLQKGKPSPFTAVLKFTVR